MCLRVHVCASEHPVMMRSGGGVFRPAAPSPSAFFFKISHEPFSDRFFSAARRVFFSFNDDPPFSSRQPGPAPYCADEHVYVCQPCNFALHPKRNPPGPPGAVGMAPRTPTNGPVSWTPPVLVPSHRVDRTPPPHTPQGPSPAAGRPPAHRGGAVVLHELEHARGLAGGGTAPGGWLMGEVGCGGSNFI